MWVRTLPKAWRSDVAVDLGTSKTAIYVRGEGVVYDEPSLVAFKDNRSRHPSLLAVGDRALKMEGKEPNGIQTVRPLSGGVIEKLEMAKLMLGEASKRSGLRRGLVRPRVLVGAPFAISDIERRAVKEVGLAIGGGAVEIIEEPIAAAIGSGIDISESVANMIVDVGGGITEVVVVSLGGIVHSESVRVGGDLVSQNIVTFLRRHYRIDVGTQTANRIKEALCCPIERADDLFTVSGTASDNHLPVSRQVRLADLKRAIESTLSTITNAIKRAFESTPPMLAGDLIDNGILLTGGGALLHGLKMTIESEIGIAVRISDDPRRSVIRGGGKVIERPSSR